MIIKRWFTERVAPASQPELEQATIRVVLSVIILVSLVWYTDRHEPASEVATKALTAMLIYLAASIAILVSIVWTGHVSVFRRYVGILVDVAAITYFMAVMGEAGAVMFGVYLFIIFGNGFRYGRVSMHVCQGLSLIGFGTVLMLDDYWSNSRSVGIACFFAMLVLPFYVSVLARRITDAKQKADEANQAKDRLLAYLSKQIGKPLNTIVAEYNESLRQEGS